MIKGWHTQVAKLIQTSGKVATAETAYVKIDLEYRSKFKNKFAGICEDKIIKSFMKDSDKFIVKALGVMTWEDFLEHTDNLVEWGSAVNLNQLLTKS